MLLQVLKPEMKKSYQTHAKLTARKELLLLWVVPLVVMQCAGTAAPAGAEM